MCHYYVLLTMCSYYVLLTMCYSYYVLLTMLCALTMCYLLCATYYVPPLLILDRVAVQGSPPPREAACVAGVVQPQLLKVVVLHASPATGEDVGDASQHGIDEKDCPPYQIEWWWEEAALAPARVGPQSWGHVMQCAWI